MNFNTANKLTILRIILIPVFVYFMYATGTIASIIAAAIFIIAAVTDFLDGYIARKYDMVSDFGKIFDPIADKALVLSALIPLAQQGMIAGWVVIVLLTREFVVGGFRNFVASKGGKVVAASYIGKAKTVTQIIMIVALILHSTLLSFVPTILIDIVVYISVILSLWSMVDYILAGKEYIQLDK